MAGNNVVAPNFGAAAAAGTPFARGFANRIDDDDDDAGGGEGGGGSGGPSGPSKRPRIPTVCETTRQSVINMRKATNVTEDERAAGICGFILRQLEAEKGALINAEDGGLRKAYLFDGIDGILYPISPRNDLFLSYLQCRFAIVGNEAITQRIVSELKGWALSERGRNVPVRRFAYFDQDEKILYISRYDGTSYRLNGQDIEVVPNSTGVLFLDDDGGQTCDAQLSPTGTVQVFDALINDLEYVPSTAGGLTPDQQKVLLKLWIMVLPFDELLPAKPLLLIEGEKGSGKTSAVQRIQAALHGHFWPMSVGKNDEANFGVTLLRRPIALIDNTDGYIEWLRNHLCAYATGAGWPRRKMYTDDQEVIIKPRSFIALATRNPATYRRDDVADRCLIIRLERRADKGGYTPMGELLDQVRRMRPVIYGEWLHYLNKIVASIQRGIPPVKSKHRMADFARMAYVIGPEIGLSVGDIDDAMDALQQEREHLVTETDPLVDVLDKWLETSSNQGRSIKLQDLFSELSEVAKKSKATFYKTSKTLADRCKENRVMLARHFEIVVNQDGCYRIRRAKTNGAPPSPAGPKAGSSAGTVFDCGFKR